MSWRRKTSDNDALTCLALANLYLLNVWRTLIVPSEQYHLMILPRPLDFAAVFANIVAIALLIYVALAVARRWMGQRGRSAVVTICLWLLFILVVKAYNVDLLWPNRVRALTLAGLGLGMLAIWKRPAVPQSIFRFVGPMLAACLAVTTWHSTKFLLQRTVQSESDLSSSIEKKSNRLRPPRTAWIIFDMLDYGLLFDHKPQNVHVPEFDKLRTESYFARNAMSPNQWTQGAIPAMTIGKTVTRAVPASRDDLLLTLPGSAQEIRWKSQPTIFSEAREAGMTAGLVGWYHPYCRLFGVMLASCTVAPLTEKIAGRDDTLWGTQRAMIQVVMHDLTGNGPHDGILRGDHNWRRNYIDSYRYVLGAATDALTNRDLDLVVIHMPVAHTPPIYDRSTQQFTTEKGDYLDNLELADRTFGLLRRSMEHAGLWEVTNILVTADHGFRDASPSEWKHTPTPLHVPFFLRMSGFQQHVEDDHRFSTILVHDLLLALLKREVATPDEARHLLDGRVHTRNRSITSE